MRITVRRTTVISLILLAFISVAVAVVLSSMNGKPVDVKTSVFHRYVTHGVAFDRCVSICKESLALGVRYDMPTCLVEDLNGNGCAVSKTGESPCGSRDVLPQIVLSPECEPLSR